MRQRIKQYIIIAIVAAAGYFLLSNHIIFYGQHVYLLKKSSLNLHYTFYSLNEKTPEMVMKIERLRDDGIGDLLVDLGIITEEQELNLESKY